MGWYTMALVDTLELLPEAHAKRAELLGILKGVLAALQDVVDPQTGVWYQVLDQGSRPGNYLESSASTVFGYALVKAARLRDLGVRLPLGQRVSTFFSFSSGAQYRRSARHLSGHGTSS